MQHEIIYFPGVDMDADNDVLAHSLCQFLFLKFLKCAGFMFAGRDPVIHVKCIMANTILIK